MQRRRQSVDRYMVPDARDAEFPGDHKKLVRVRRITGIDGFETSPEGGQKGARLRTARKFITKQSKLGRAQPAEFHHVCCLQGPEAKPQ